MRLLILFPSFFLSTVISWIFVAITIASEYPSWTPIPPEAGLPAHGYGLCLLHLLVFLGLALVKQSNPLIYTQIERIFVYFCWLMIPVCPLPSCNTFSWQKWLYYVAQLGYLFLKSLGTGETMQISESSDKNIKNKSAFDVEYQFYPSYLMV